MYITIAGERKEVKQGITVQELIVQENIDNPLYVTVSKNDDFVAREQFESEVLQDGDNIEFLYFMGGGAHGFFE